MTFLIQYLLLHLVLPLVPDHSHHAVSMCWMISIPPLSLSALSCRLYRCYLKK